MHNSIPPSCNPSALFPCQSDKRLYRRIPNELNYPICSCLYICQPKEPASTAYMDAGQICTTIKVHDTTSLISHIAVVAAASMALYVLVLLIRIALAVCRYALRAYVGSPSLDETLQLKPGAIIAEWSSVPLVHNSRAPAQLVISVHEKKRWNHPPELSA